LIANPVFEFWVPDIEVLKQFEMTRLQLIAPRSQVHVPLATCEADYFIARFESFVLRAESLPDLGKGAPETTGGLPLAPIAPQVILKPTSRSLVIGGHREKRQDTTRLLSGGR
jgi:hypothetical protein